VTRSATVYTSVPDSTKAGEELAGKIRATSEAPPDALIVFASSRHDHSALLGALHRSCAPKAIVGSSSAGEFTSDEANEGAVSAVALWSDEMRFTPALGCDLRGRPAEAARQMAAAFTGMGKHEFTYRSALVMTDALAGQADAFVEQLTLLTAGTYQLFGGGAGDDAKFTRTHVFFGTEAVPNAAVGLEILSNRPVGVGVRHGWELGSKALRVTEADGMRLISLNGTAAADVFEEHAEETGQKFDRKDPISFFLHNVIGITTPAGPLLRVPLSVNDDGSINCAAEVPTGASVHIMAPRALSALAATKSALAQLQGTEPEVALFFDCVATRLRMGREFGFELNAVRDALGGARYAGCNTYGQIARAEGQFNGFHNCTAVVAVIPK
jgi:hypothetical protein